LHDPVLGTQWVWRADGLLQINLTAVSNRAQYEEPALQVNTSRQVGARLLLNLDADAPKFLFENAEQLAFDRDFATDTTTNDLIMSQTTYTYRGLWVEPLLNPHPFVEGYIESEFARENSPFHHLLLRPKVGWRSFFSRVLSLKAFGGLQYEVFDPHQQVYAGLGVDLLLKPWVVALSNGALQLEGNVTYYWNAPGSRDQHTLRGQLIGSFQLIGPLQVTLSTIAALRKDGHELLGKSFGLQAGIRVRFVSRNMLD
jgi:hypothetical protein